MPDKKLQNITAEVNSKREGTTEAININAYDTYDTHLRTIEVNECSQVVFFGYSDNKNVLNYFNGKQFHKAIEFLKTAVNNRTIERDYFRRYCEMLLGEVSEDDFEKEIDEHEDWYVVSNHYVPDKDDIRLAFCLSDGLKDVKTSEDLASLFSFDVLKTDNLLQE